MPSCSAPRLHRRHATPVHPVIRTLDEWQREADERERFTTRARLTAQLMDLGGFDLLKKVDEQEGER